MATLQELLNLGLVDIGSDDSRFEKMQSASSALQAKFKEEPGLLVPATLISLDEGVDEDDPMFSLVEDLVLAEWKTLRNTHVNRPRELLRSIMIDALSTAVSDDHVSAAVVWNSAASPLRHQQMRLGKAGSLIGDILRSAGELAERQAVARAGMATAPIKKRGRKQAERSPLKISATIEDQDIVADVARAAGPQYGPVPNLESPNPHWPNTGHPWSNEFTPRMAAALSKVVSLGNARVGEVLAKQLAAHLDEFDKQLAEQFREVERLMQSQETSRMRLDVLWWSEALYSPTLNTSYRELELPVAALAAAVDLAGIVPPLAPASVCYVLSETLFRVSRLRGGSGDLSVEAFMDGIAKAKTEFGERLVRSPTSKGRVPLVDLVAESARGARVSAETLRHRAGVDPALMLTPSEFAMWVFRGIQASRLVETLR